MKSDSTLWVSTGHDMTRRIEGEELKGKKVEIGADDSLVFPTSS
jgi:hypothetical protein